MSDQDAEAWATLIVLLIRGIDWAISGDWLGFVEGVALGLAVCFSARAAWCYVRPAAGE